MVVKSFSRYTKEKDTWYEILADTMTRNRIINFHQTSKKVISAKINKGILYTPIHETVYFGGTLCYVFKEAIVSLPAISYVVFGYNKSLYKVPFNEFINISTTDNAQDEIYKNRYVKIKELSPYILAKD